VQDAEGDVRALLLGLESRVGFAIDAMLPILTFMPEYDRRLMVGKD
jgi:hypothetical protein